MALSKKQILDLASSIFTALAILSFVAFVFSYTICDLFPKYITNPDAYDPVIFFVVTLATAVLFSCAGTILSAVSRSLHRS